MSELESEIDRLDALVNEKDAEIERLRKALEQAINIGEIGFEPYGNVWSPTLQTGHACEIPIDGAFFELAAYLRERDSRPPTVGEER